MPYEVRDVSTPLKQRRWGRFSESSTASTELDDKNLNASLDKSCFENSKLDVDEIEEDVNKLLQITDDAHMGSFLEDEYQISKNSSVLALEKSRRSIDSGISSLETEESVRTPPTKELSCTSAGSLQSDFKYKISIYSKVSGCRMTNLTDYWIVKQIRVAILQRLTDGNPIQALSYKFGYEKMANGGLQIISDSEELINMLGSLGYFAGIPCKMTFPDTPRVVGFIKGLPTDLEPSDLKSEIRKTFPEVYSVRYVTERSRGVAHGMQRPCAFVSFNLRLLPSSVKIFDEVFELQVPNPMQCTRCCRYGHQGKQCRAQSRCSFCGGTHQRQLCSAKVPSCINCQGTHTATSHDCLIWQQGKLMNELRYRGGMSAEEAINIASSGKVSQKKHSFTQADFFENQDSYYFGNNADTSASADKTVVAQEVKHLSPPITAGKLPSVHSRTYRIFPFLDLMTDFFLKVKNPNENYTNAVLVPGYDDLGFPIKKTRKNSAVGKHFKESVQALISLQNSGSSSPLTEDGNWKIEMEDDTSMPSPKA